MVKKSDKDKKDNTQVNSDFKSLTSTEILEELVKKQIKDIPYDKKLRYNDLVRVCKLITSSIFDENVCSLWKNYTDVASTSSKKSNNRSPYINFYFRKRKTALHRLLYCNYVEELSSDEYLKFSCPNKGKCCNINHIKKFGYKNVGDNSVKNKDTNTSTSTTDTVNESDKVDNSVSVDNLNIFFD